MTDRPDFTESAEVVPTRRVQFEGGATFSRAGSETSLNSVRPDGFFGMGASYRW